MHELFHPALEAVSDAVLAVASRLPVEKSCGRSSSAHASSRALTTPRSDDCPTPAPRLQALIAIGFRDDRDSTVRLEDRPLHTVERGTLRDPCLRFHLGCPHALTSEVPFDGGPALDEDHRLAFKHATEFREAPRRVRDRDG